jgi:flagellar biosynthesis anti-sigma factor FlgM
MRIDLTTNSMPEMERSQGSAGSSRATPGLASGVPPNADDVAQLSTGSDAVASLRSQLDGVPDVRQQRIDFLRQSMNAGQFVISPERIAEGMLSGSIVAAH